MSPAALRELIGATPWVRRLARLTVLSIAIQLLTLVALLRHRLGLAAASGAVGASAANIIVWSLFLAALRRYLTASARLREPGAPAIGAVIAAQLGCTGVAALLGLLNALSRF